MAEDIVQESYCAAYMCWDILKAHPNKAGWLYKTAGYIGGNMRRRKDNQAASLEELQEAGAVPLATPDVYGEVELQIVLQKLLPPTEWELLKKYYIEGYGSADIAQQLGISEENVRMRLSRMRRKLRERLRL